MGYTGVQFDQSQLFTDNGINYGLQISLKNPETHKTLYIDNNTVIEFNYSNSINQFYLTGNLIVMDTQGKLGQVFGLPFATVNVYMAKFVDAASSPSSGPSGDGNFSSNKKLVIDDDFTFYHSFLINKAGIENRSKNAIIYNLELISYHSIMLEMKHFFTNYNLKSNAEEKKLYYILNKIMKDTFSEFDNGKGMINIDTFNKIQDYEELHIDYCTSQNDNVKSIFNYLMNKQYDIRYCEGELENKLPKSLKFIYFDEYNNKFKMFDFAKYKETCIDMMSGGSSIVSINGTKIEDYIYQFPQNFASVVKMTNTEFLNIFMPKNMTRVDNHKDFILEDKTAEYILNKEKQFSLTKFFSHSAPAASDGPENYVEKIKYKDLEENFKLKEIESKKDKGYSEEESEWSNNRNSYTQMLNILCFKDAFIINTAGQIRHQPGGHFVISPDDSNPGNLQLEPADLQKDKNKQILGYFMVLKCRHIVKPSSKAQNKYTENLILNRLAVPKSE